MKNLIIKITFILLPISALSLSASALFELRASYGFQTVDPNFAASAPAFTKLDGFGVDAIISPPLFPLAFGLRYEKLGNKETNASGFIDVDYTRTAALVSWRPLDTVISLGLIASFGLSHSGKATVDLAGTSDDANLTLKSTSSIGVEAGIKLAGFLVGAEVGQLNMSQEGGATSNPDLKGIYAKAHIGLDF